MVSVHWMSNFKQNFLGALLIIIYNFARLDKGITAVIFQVLSVIRSNYDTLTLKLQENLDHYEKYSEKPKEAAFFTQLVRAAF